MSMFEPGWLDLRAAADNAARDAVLLRAASDYANMVERPLIVDLGTGTGATARVMADLVSGARWRLVDGDAALLALAEQRCADLAIEAKLRDLVAPDPLPIDDARLVTASALLDLVSSVWIDRLASEIAASGAAFYAPLNFDGRISWQAGHETDPAIGEAFNAHQRGDKGFGPALGADAAMYARERFAAMGYRVRLAPSPWQLDGRHSDLIQELIEGIADAVAETGLVDASVLTSWKSFRSAHSDSGCEIGHYDLFALPPSSGA